MKLIKFLGVVLGVIVAFLIIQGYIENIVYQTATNEKFLHKVSLHVRPALIFDEKFSILADQGGTEYIEDIEISLDENGAPTQMVVHAKTHLPYAPFLQSMTANEYKIEAMRSTKHDWVFTLRQHGTGRDKYKFRLEIIK